MIEVLQGWPRLLSITQESPRIIALRFNSRPTEVCVYVDGDKVVVTDFHSFHGNDRTTVTLPGVHFAESVREEDGTLVVICLMKRTGSEPEPKFLPFKAIETD